MSIIATISSTWKKTAVTVAVCALGAGSLAGCGTASAAATADHPQTLTVALSSINIPYSYVDKDNKLVGFEAEVLRAVDKELPEYKFDLKPYDYAGVLAQLNAGKSDLAVASLDVTKERADKFGITGSYVKGVTKLTVAADNTKITSLADLKGTSHFGQTTAYPPSQVIEKYNKEHNANITIDYGNLSVEQLVTALVEGKYDSAAINPVNVNAINAKYGNKLKSVGPDLTSASIVAYAPNKKLAALPKIDTALKKLYEDGTLKKLSEQYLGADYSQYVSPEDLEKKL